MNFKSGAPAQKYTITVAPCLTLYLTQEILIPGLKLMHPPHLCFSRAFKLDIINH